MKFFFKLLNSVYSLLNLREKKISIYLVFFSLIGIILESIGVVLILPITSLLIGSNVPQQFEFFGNFLNDINFLDNSLILGMGIVILVYLIKNLYLLILHYFQVKFSQTITRRISKDLFEKYINSKYSFYLNSNSSLLIRNLQDAGRIEAIYIRIISLITELIVILTFVSIFFIIDFKTTINITIVFVVVSSLFIISLKNRIPKWGQIRFELSGKYLKTINHGLNGIKEIIFSNGQDFFVNRADKIKKKFLNTQVKIAVVDFIPKVLIELLIIICVVITVVSLTLTGKTYEYIVPLLAVYVAAAFRLAPAANKIINYVQSLEFANATITNLYKQINLNEYNVVNKTVLEKKNKLKFENNISLVNLSFSFNTNSQIYDDLNFNFQKNKIYGFKGGSGSGKSTFINLLTGLLKPNSGKILVDGVDINENIYDWQNKISYVPQDIFLLDDTILNNIAFGKNEDEIDQELVSEVLNQSGLKIFVDQLKNGADTIVGEKGVKISGGQKQRIGLARALYKKPKILVLDEATNSLDNSTEKGILDSLKKLNDITIFLVSHQTAPFYICDEIFEIKGKQLLKISAS
tara:strand:- start:189 stop:1922 length:1734 start_codon:yes stop_codon:yes gene_type:complete